MSKFNVSQTIQGPSLEIDMDGEISIDSKLPELALKDMTTLKIDVGDVTYINSEGLRNWIMWMDRVVKSAPTIEVIFSRVPFALVKQINSLDNFIPASSKVTSLYVPYFCESCNLDSSKLAQHGADYGKGKTEAEILAGINTAKCPKCGIDVEMDAIPKYYLKVISRHGSF